MPFGFDLPSWINNGEADDPAGGRGPERNNGSGGFMGFLNPDKGPPTAHEGTLINQDQRAAQRRAALHGIHSAAGDEFLSNYGTTESGDRFPNTQANTARYLIRNARRGNLDEGMMDRYLPGPVEGPMSDRTTAERGALSTLQDDFAPLREARTALQTARSERRSLAPGDRGDMRDDVQNARQSLQEARRAVWQPERHGMSQAEWAARPTGPRANFRSAGRGMGRR